MRHYLFDLVLAVALVVGLWRRNDVALIAAGLGLTYLAPFILVDPCPDWRYQFFNYLMSLICIALLLQRAITTGLERRQPKAIDAPPRGREL